MRATEEQPLLGPILDDVEDATKHDEIILDFDPEGDPANPRDWKPAFKYAIVLLLACMAFTVTFTCIGVVPVASTIVEDLSHGKPSSSSSALLVTIWELGEAAGPLLIAPMSELYGRYPVVNVCNVLFISTTLLAAFSQTTNLFIAARALTGVTVAANVLNPAIIGDLFESDERGSAMSLVMLAPLIGGAIGPTISGAIAQTLGWREMLFIAAGLAVVCELLFLTCFRETYKMTILRKRHAKASVGEDGSALASTNGHENLLKLWRSVTRPATVLFGSNVLLALSLFGSVAFSYFYVMSVTLPTILQEIYGFSPAATGASFMTFSIGSLISVGICNVALDKIYIRLRKNSGTNGKPEHRLPLSIIGAFLLPLAIVAYGWVTYFRLPAPLLLACMTFMGGSLMLTVIPLMAYVVDAFNLYSASAMTGIIVTRCLMGTFLPLLSDPLITHFGFGWGFMCFGGLSLCLAPIPMIVFFRGEQWRQRSKYTKDS